MKVYLFAFNLIHNLFSYDQGYDLSLFLKKSYFYNILIFISS